MAPPAFETQLSRKLGIEQAKRIWPPNHIDACRRLGMRKRGSYGVQREAATVLPVAKRIWPSLAIDAAGSWVP
jgi:hypothetical protein